MWRLIVTLLLLVSSTAPALAHSAQRGFVLLLPANYVIFGGALTVLAWFLIVSLIGGRCVRSQTSAVSPPQTTTIVPSLISALLLCVLIVIGFTGPHDPAENLLPLVIWTLWWVVLVLLHPVFGNLWAGLNPFTGMHQILTRLSGRPLASPLLRFPPSLAYWPALLIFAGFAWFQLVAPGPEDPPRLAFAVALYAAVTMIAVVVFGPATWLGQGDAFSILFRQLGAAAPFTRSGLRLPGAGLVALAPLPIAGTFFLLLTLSSISFDGFANTFLWLSLIDVNPLDYPGRTALMRANTLGLAGSFGALVFVYIAVVAGGWFWAGRHGALGSLLGQFVLSLIPISIAYHLAHYLGDTLLNLQYLALALNDPLATGANLLGLNAIHPTASFQNTASGALTIFSIQTAAIIIGHVIAVAVAHAMAIDQGLSRAAAMKLEAPLAGFMVIYTAFGLWLLATPAIA